jgi:hypothetical protein
MRDMTSHVRAANMHTGKPDTISPRVLAGFILLVAVGISAIVLITPPVPGGDGDVILPGRTNVLNHPALPQIAGFLAVTTCICILLWVWVPRNNEESRL